ncbi:MAG: hypothetical protein CMM07_12000 [Rhodopirellula sp.]|nr:hypothetical protein [Rhodopirellula sp.]
MKSRNPEVGEDLTLAGGTARSIYAMQTQLNHAQMSLQNAPGDKLQALSSLPSFPPLLHDFLHQQPLH